MRRTFLSRTFGKFEDEAVSVIIDGIQKREGEIINVALSPITANGIYERLLVFYEDHDNFEEIKEFLKPYLIIK